MVASSRPFDDFGVLLCAFGGGGRRSDRSVLPSRAGIFDALVWAVAFQILVGSASDPGSMARVSTCVLLAGELAGAGQVNWER